MIDISKTQDQILMKRNTAFLRIGVVILFMAAVGIRFLFEILPFEEGYTLGDVFGLLFLCVWIALVLTMGVFAIATNSHEVTISANGILCRSFLRRRWIEWEAVKDWGLSYCGQTRGEGNTYWLYFSDHVCLAKNECRKQLKGKMVKTFVMGDEYSKAVDMIIPFCAERTGVPPFIGKDKYHFF